VGRAPLTAFIVLTFVLSWLAWLPLVASGATVRPGQLPTHFVGLVGPAVAAVVVAALTGGLPRLWARVTRWRVALGWYLLAAVAPVAVLAVALAVEAAVGAGQPDLAGLRRYSGLPELAIPVVYVLVLLGNGFGEEIGWRGCALPLLQRRHGPIGATALLTVVWAAWHLPQFAVLETYRTMSVMVVPGFVLGLFAGAVVFTWIMAQTDSVLIAALFHASYNMVVATRVGGDLTASISTTVVMAGAVVLLWRQVSARRVDRPGPLQPTPRSVAA
jgi:membrane protease YdiL (CAAX protease family)